MKTQTMTKSQLLIQELPNKKLAKLVNLIKNDELLDQFKDKHYKAINNALKETMNDLKAFSHFVADKLILVEAINRLYKRV